MIHSELCDFLGNEIDDSFENEIEVPMGTTVWFLWGKEHDSFANNSMIPTGIRLCP